MFDPVFCNACGETNEIGGLIGELTNDCPNCARPVLFKQQLANQGGYQPAIVTGLALVLKEGDTFRSRESHIDFPNQLLSIPKGCIGIVQKYQYNDTEGTVSILSQDTITARRLIAQAKQKEFNVSANEDRVNKLAQLDSLSWHPVYMRNGALWKNRVSVSFLEKEEAVKFYNLLVSKNCAPMRDWN